MMATQDVLEWHRVFQLKQLKKVIKKHSFGLLVCSAIVSEMVFYKLEGADIVMLHIPDAPVLLCFISQEFYGLETEWSDGWLGMKFVVMINIVIYHQEYHTLNTSY